MSEIKKVGVIGCGLMGQGIAQVSAASGYQTVVREVNDDLLQAGLAAIGKQLNRAVDKGKLEEAERDATLGRLSGTVSLDELADCDIIVEAIVEDIEIKKDLFVVLDRQCPESTIFAPISVTVRLDVLDAKFVGDQAVKGSRYERIGLYEAAYEPERFQFYAVKPIPFVRELRKVGADHPFAGAS